MKTFLPLMTSVESAEAVGRGAAVLLPIGTCEVNGPQLPVGYDYLVSSALAEEVAGRTSGVWLPPITYGVSEAMASFPGTVSVPHPVLAAQVEGILRSLVRHGFTHVVVVNNHIPNQYPVEYVCRALRRETGVLVASLFPSQIARDVSSDLYDEEPDALGHGAEPGTSLMLHLHPSAVRMDLVRPSRRRRFQGLEVVSPFAARFGGSEVNLYLDLDDITDTGGWADPSHASAERGAIIFERMVRYTEAFVLRFQEIQTVAGESGRRG